MGLEEDLKARTLALISQQMANWVVEIQRLIQDHQANLVRSLDELGESAARYDERINEDDIAAAMAEVVAQAGPMVGAGPDYSALRAALQAVERGSSLSEVLTHLVNEVSRYVDRVGMFIVKGSNAIGWYARGLQSPEAIKSVSLPLGGDTVFRLVYNSRHAERGHIGHSPGTAQALARLGGDPQGILAVPLILRDKVAAILYCDTAQDELPQATADMIEILVSFAGKTIDLLALARPAGAAAAGATGERHAPPARAAAPEAAAPPRAPATAGPAPGPETEGASTVMFNAASFAQARQQAGVGTSTARPAPRPAPAPAAAPAARALSPEDQKAHEDAKRFARLVVSEIKLYNEAKVSEGRRSKDIYERLKDDIERGRQMYLDRVPPPIRDNTNYFYDELVRILGGGDAGALGAM